MPNANFNDARGPSPKPEQSPPPPAPAKSPNPPAKPEQAPGPGPGQSRPADAPRVRESADGPEQPTPAPAARPGLLQQPADRLANPIPPERAGDPLAEYRAAYRALRDRDPDLARKYPNPDEPGRNIDAATVLEQLRGEPGGLTTDGPGDVHA